jgi:hypothetical protein
VVLGSVLAHGFSASPLATWYERPLVSPERGRTPKGELHMKTRSGWATFGGVMILVVGALNLFDGLVAITQSRYIERNIGGELPITNNVKDWGWAALILGVLLLLVGFGIFSGAVWARIVGIVLVSLNLLFQFAYLGHYPFWSFTMIIIDLLVVFALVSGYEDVEYSDA